MATNNFDPYITNPNARRREIIFFTIVLMIGLISVPSSVVFGHTPEADLLSTSLIDIYMSIVFVMIGLYVWLYCGSSNLIDTQEELMCYIDQFLLLNLVIMILLLVLTANFVLIHMLSPEFAAFVVPIVAAVGIIVSFKALIFGLMSHNFVKIENTIE